MVACAGGPPGPAAAGAADPWEGLARPRPDPLAGAPRIAVSDFALPEDAWELSAPLPPSVGLTELVAAGLLRRPDVRFVERRRFLAASERERRGLPIPAGAPPLGTSAGAELVLGGTWLVLGDSAFLSLRLFEPGGGRVRAGWRVAAPRVADPVSLARQVTGSLLEALDDLGLRPPWEDPLPGAAPARFTPSGVPLAAAEAFLRGIVAEDRYDWEAARAAYRHALNLGGGAFFEADAALARAARLRAGGTLGAS